MRAVTHWRSRELLMAALFLAAIFGIVVGTEGCLTDQMHKDVASDVYAAQQAACIDQYADKASIDKCRERVTAKWAAADAGTIHATGTMVILDAGRTLAFANDNDAGKVAPRDIAVSIVLTDAGPEAGQ